MDQGVEPTTPSGLVLLKMATSLIPVAGGTITVLLDAVEERRHARVRDALDAAGTVLTEQQLEDLEDLLAHDQELQGLLLDAVESAQRTRSEEAVQALGGSLGAALGGAPISQEFIVMRALDGLHVGHLQVLRLLAEALEYPGVSPDVVQAEVGEVAMAPIIGELSGRQLIASSSYVRSPSVDGSPGGVRTDGFWLSTLGATIAERLELR